MKKANGKSNHNSSADSRRYGLGPKGKFNLTNKKGTAVMKNTTKKSNGKANGKKKVTAQFVIPTPLTKKIAAAQKVIAKFSKIGKKKLNEKQLKALAAAKQSIKDGNTEIREAKKTFNLFQKEAHMAERAELRQQKADARAARQAEIQAKKNERIAAKQARIDAREAKKKQLETRKRWKSARNVKLTPAMIKAAVKTIPDLKAGEIKRALRLAKKYSTLPTKRLPVRARNLFLQYSVLAALMGQVSTVKKWA